IASYCDAGLCERPQESSILAESKRPVETEHDSFRIPPMKIFKCGSCEQVVFFESFVCTRCNHTLAYLPDHAVVSSLENAGSDVWNAPGSPAAGERYRLCRNYVDQAVCNWAIPEQDNEEY